MLRLSQSPTDPGFVQDPYPFYDRARAGGDLFFWDDIGMVAATSHDAVSALLRDRRFGREAPPDRARAVPPHLAPFEAVERHSLLAMEPPRHSRLRGLVVRAFTSRRVAQMAGSIEALCHDLIDGFPDGPFDLMAAFARPLPVIVICRLLGVPEARADDLLAWSNAMVAMYQSRRSAPLEHAAAAAASDFAAFIRGHLEARRRAPSDDLLTELIAAEEAGDRLSTDELVGIVILLLNAGHEATVNSLGNGVKALLAHGFPEPDAATVEEILRWDPPLHLFDRWASEEALLFGHRFRPGDRVALLLGAANRDPAAYPDPARFDAGRAGPANTAFGAGIHFCVGAPLARLELLVAFRALRARLPRLRLAEAPIYADRYHFRGLERLIVAAR